MSVTAAAVVVGVVGPERINFVVIAERVFREQRARIHGVRTLAVAKVGRRNQRIAIGTVVGAEQRQRRRRDENRR